MRNRLEKGRLSKARRGELFFQVPIGYVKLPTGSLALDPDEQVRSVVGLIFDKFGNWERHEGLSVSAAARHSCGDSSPCGAGPRPSGVATPSASTIYSMLHHPFYAGTYAYGWCAWTRNASMPAQTGRRKVPRTSGR